MKRIYLLVILTVFAQSIFAQTADDIINKMIEASGGVAAYKQINTKKIEINVTMPDGNEIQIKTANKRPSLYYQSQLLPNGSTVYKIHTPSKALASGMDGNLSELSEDGKQALQYFEGDFDGPLFEYSKKGHKATLVGSEKINGKENFKITLTLTTGSIMHYWIDEQTFLVTRFSRTAKGMMGDLEVVATLSDYRTVNGIKIAFEQSIDQGSMGVLTAKIVSAQMNVEVPDSFFNATQG